MPDTTKTYTLRLSGFEFPGDLSDGDANFRFVSSVRYTNSKGEFRTESSILPGADIYWECDPSKSDAPNYVRGPDTVAGNGTFDLARIDPWNRLILRFRGKQVDSVRIKIIDVDRPDMWDKIHNILGSIVGALFGRTRSLDFRGSHVVISDSLGAAADEIESYLLKKISGGDKVLYQGSTTFGHSGKGTTAHRVPGKDSTGAGSKGNYRVDLELEVSDT